MQLANEEQLSQDYTIALYWQLRWGESIPHFTIQASDKGSLNAKLKRLIIRGGDAQADERALLASSHTQQFMRKLQSHIAEGGLKERLLSGLNEKQGPVDFSKPLKEAKVEPFRVSQAIETLFLVLYSVMTSHTEDSVKADARLEHTVHLVYDVLAVTIDKMDPWYLQQILSKVDPDLIKARLGATGETLYDITERFVVTNWHLFSDEFRAYYRETLYED